MYDVFVKLNVTLAIEYIYGSSLKRKYLNASGCTILLTLMILECLMSNKLVMVFHSITNSSNTDHVYDSFCNDAHT